MSDQPSIFDIEGGLSLVDDADYPELLRDLARIVVRELVAAGTERNHAMAIAETVTEHVMDHHGGVPQYWPKGERFRKAQRRRLMWERFNGTNHAELAKAFGMCLQQVYKWLAISRAEDKARRQTDLFAQTKQLLEPLERSTQAGTGRTTSSA